MELRSCNQSLLHFINAIEGGKMIKVFNVTRRGPKLSFKKVSEIYGIVDFNSQAPPSTLNPKDEPDRFVFGDGPPLVERTCLPLMEAGRVEVETNHEGSSTASVDNTNEGSNDLGITLKQIKDKCKTMKRKLSKGIISITQTKSTPSHVKVEEIKIVDDDINLLEPLSVWRSKLLKDKKLKKKSMNCKVKISSEGVVSTVKSQEITTCPDGLLFTGSSTAILGIKSESSEPEFSEILQVHESIRSSSSCDDTPNMSCDSMSSKVPGTANGCTRVSDVINETTIKIPCYAHDNVSHEFSDLMPFQMRDSGWDIMLGDSQHTDEFLLDLPVLETPDGGVNHLGDTCALDVGMLIFKAESKSCMVSETCNECHDMMPIQQSSHLHTLELQNGGHATHSANEKILESENSLSSTNEHRACVLNKEYFGPLEHFNLNPVQNVGAKVDEEYELPQSSSHSSDKFPLEFVEEQGNAHTYSHDLIHTATPTEDNVSANNNSEENKLQWLAEEENEALLLKVSVKDGIQGLNVNDGEHPLGYDKISENVSPCTCTRTMICNSIGDCFPSLSSYTVSHKEVPPETEKKQSSNPLCADEKRNPYVFTEDLSTDGDESDSYFKLHRPVRLLSSRKAISPTSQKKLCEALQSIELRETQRFKCREKLNFGNHTVDQNHTAEGHYKISRARFTYNRKQPVGKSNTYKRGHLSESVLKNPHVYHAPHVNNRCTSTQNCSENAIAFSQRQMHDIECLATKLTKELMSMKDAVEDILESQSSATSMKHKMDKARIAVKNANRVEEVSKRRLSTMSRDCSRFCKIMRLTENGSPSSQNATSKVKKISFADEAGGKLCNIKLFETDVVSLSD